MANLSTIYDNNMICLLSVLYCILLNEYILYVCIIIDIVEYKRMDVNEKNLITGTRYLNVEGMLPFENMVADYIKETDYHVLYRVTPIFDGDNLVADGVQMEAESVEDNGDGILFNVFCYNVQPGINIDYATGVSSLSGESTDVSADTANTEYVLNVNTKKFHKPTCSAAKQMKEENKQEYSGSRDNLITQGYEPCKKCNP